MHGRKTPSSLYKYSSSKSDYLMTIQKTLVDVLKQCNLPKIEILKITPEKDNRLCVQTYDSDRVLFIDATTKAGHPEVTGEFGLMHFKTLRGLLNLPNFAADGAKFEVGTRTINGQSYPDSLKFAGGGSRATFRLVNHEVVPEQPKILNIPWDITFNMSPQKLAEFTQMASLYSDVEGLFTVRTEDNALLVDFGNDSASTHSGTMRLVEDITDTIVEMRFPIQLFLALMKLTGDANSEIRLTSKGLLGIVVENEWATYNYYLKKSL